jgi:hypothetical protein
VYSASIILRKYVRERWSPYFSTFRGDAAPHEVKSLFPRLNVYANASAQVKAQIRQTVFQGLSDPVRQIRTLCVRRPPSSAYAYAQILPS